MAISAKGIGEYPLSLRRLLACGVIGPLFFITVFLVEGATRPDYSPLRHLVSSLAYGDWGWTQRANFVISGLLLLTFAMGLQRMLRPLRDSVWGPLLIGLAGIGLIGAGFFVADPLNGYPLARPSYPQSVPFTECFTTSLGFQYFWACPLPVLCFADSLLERANADGRTTLPLTVWRC